MMQITIRPATLEDANIIADIYIEGWQTTYKGFVPEKVLQSFDREKEAKGCRSFQMSEGPHFIEVAEWNGEVVGYVSGGPYSGETVKFDGEVYEIFIRKEYQNKGIGRMLLHRAGEWFQSQGHTSVGIWAWHLNPCRAFYERVGGQVAGTVVHPIGGTELIVDIFGWTLEELLSQTRLRDC